MGPLFYPKEAALGDDARRQLRIYWVLGRKPMELGSPPTACGDLRFAPRGFPLGSTTLTTGRYEGLNRCGNWTPDKDVGVFGKSFLCSGFFKQFHNLWVFLKLCNP